jgi:hypothetical protein
VHAVWADEGTRVLEDGVADVVDFRREPERADTANDLVSDDVGREARSGHVSARIGAVVQTSKKWEGCAERTEITIRREWVPMDPPNGATRLIPPATRVFPGETALAQWRNVVLGTEGCDLTRWRGRLLRQRGGMRAPARRARGGEPAELFVYRGEYEPHAAGTVMHEIGHLLGLTHAERGLMQPSWLKELREADWKSPDAETIDELAGRNHPETGPPREETHRAEHKLEGSICASHEKSTQPIVQELVMAERVTFGRSRRAPHALGQDS